MSGHAAGRTTLFAVLALIVGLNACAAPTASPSVTPPATLTQTALRFGLLDEFGMLWFCDPDSFPVPRDNEPELAAKQLPAIQADRDAFLLILARRGIPSGITYDAGQVLAIYRDWKMLNAIALEPIGNRRYRFDLLTTVAPDAAEGLRTAGIIDDVGAITIEQQAPSGPPNCPICLARGSLIATPDGPRAVQDLRVGDPVWTLDLAGVRVAGTVIRAGSVAAPRDHHVVHLVLDDGRELVVSPGHPLVDGRRVGDLRVGDTLDGALVIGADLVSYADDRTYDLLPSGSTGAYWAGGILIGSTFKP
jgi:hypothetical protein